MKTWEKYSTLVCCILCVLLGEFVCFGEAQVTITIPPENKTVCRGSNVNISCGYQWATALPVTWIINETSFTQDKVKISPLYQLNSPTSPMRVSLTVFSINGTTTFQCIVLNQSTPVTNSTRGTVIVISELTPIMVTADVNFNSNTMVFKVSWKIINSCSTANIIMYNITVMDQYSPAIVTVPADMSSVEISQFPYNGTSIVANREYNITVSAISDQGRSYPSDPVVIYTFNLQNCNVTSPSVGTIKVSCDSSYQIQVNAICQDLVNNCNNYVVTNNGYSPLTVMGLDPRQRYAVTVHVFDGDQVVSNIEGITKTILVTSSTSSSSSTTMSPEKIPSSITTLSAATSSSSLSTSMTTLSPATLSSSLSTSMTSSSESTTSSSATPMSSVSLPQPSGSNNDSDSGGSSGGSSVGGIAGGVIGGIVVVIVIIIIIIVICYFIFYKNKESTYDDTRNLKSPPGTGGTHASEGDTNVTTDNNAQYDKVVYAAPVQAATIPHQAVASGEQYAVSTKAVNKTSEKNLPQEHVDAPDTTKDFQGVTYADLQELPSTDSGNKQFPNPHPASAYAELLM